MHTIITLLFARLTFFVLSVSLSFRFSHSLSCSLCRRSVFYSGMNLLFIFIGNKTKIWSPFEIHVDHFGTIIVYYYHSLSSIRLKWKKYAWRHTPNISALNNIQLYALTFLMCRSCSYSPIVACSFANSSSFRSFHSSSESAHILKPHHIGVYKHHLHAAIAKLIL